MGNWIYGNTARWYSNSLPIVIDGPEGRTESQSKTRDGHSKIDVTISPDAKLADAKSDAPQERIDEMKKNFKVHMI